MNQLKNPQMAVAVLALFVALSGTSYAAVTLPKNSVSAKQIKKGSIDSSKVKDGSLLSADFASGQIPAGPKGDTGPAGPSGAVGAVGPKGDAGAKGATGEKGATGDTGATGAFSHIVVWRKDYTLNNGDTSDSIGQSLTAVGCAAGETLISGGGNFAPINPDDAMFTGSGPRGGTPDSFTALSDGETPTVWRVTAVNPTGGSTTPVVVRVFAICAS